MLDLLVLFEKLMLFFFSPKCYEEIFLNFNFTNIDCLKMAVSKCLGYGILAGSMLIKVPQILIILRAKSGDGISFSSELLMLIAVFGSMSYGYHKQFAISVYGDTYFLFLQSVIILLLMLYYSKSMKSLLLITITLAISCALLFTNNLPTSVILGLNGIQLILSLISKLNQTYLNYSNSSTGNLSAITLWLQFLGCVARIFTSIQETGDFTLILTYILISLANGILVLQLVYYSKYGNKKQQQQQQQQEKKTKKAQ